MYMYNANPIVYVYRDDLHTQSKITKDYLPISNSDLISAISARRNF